VKKYTNKSDFPNNSFISKTLCHRICREENEQIFTRKGDFVMDIDGEHYSFDFAIGNVEKISSKERGA
jgi:hypothetical protein